MPDTKEKTDCEVCKQLIKEKHKFDFIWKIACIIFAVIAAIFICLYFGSGAMTTETQITIDNVGIDNDIIDNDGTVIVGNGGEAITGTIEKTDYAPLICIAVVAGAVIIVFGGIIIANNHKKNN